MAQSRKTTRMRQFALPTLLMPVLRTIAFAISVLASVSSASAWEDTPRLNIYQLAYPVEWNGKRILIGARLQLPVDVKGKFPAVIILHGTGGIRYSGVYYAAALNKAGIATLEVDQWGGRGLTGVASSRPKGRGDMLADIGGAFRMLAERPDIDSRHIGLMGSSMGGGETLLMMTRHWSEAILGSDAQIKAAVALYPVCWVYNHVPGAEFGDLVNAPIRIMIGSADDYDGGGGGPARPCSMSFRHTMPRMFRCGSFPARRIYSTAFPALTNSMIREPTGAKGGSSTCDRMRKHVDRPATI
jgi:dienelactone hydrolase